MNQYEEVNFASPKAIIPNNTKAQVLNGIDAKLKSLKIQAEIRDDTIIINSIISIEDILNDAYNITMYRFQFQNLINIINEEIRNIEDIIEYS